jgi:F0F1-type ATP synthase delta subunit
MVLTVARSADEGRFAKKAKQVLEEMGMKVADLKTQVDDALIGGWRLEGRETLVDHSYKSQLLSMYNRATNA